MRCNARPPIFPRSFAASLNTSAANAVAASQITPFAAYYEDALDPDGNCPTHCPTWTNALVFGGSAATGDIFFKISQGLNQAGIVTLGSGNANGQDGNPTLSGGVRVSLENNGGTFVTLDNGENNVSQLTQAAAFVLGATGHTTGKLELVGSGSGVLILQTATGSLGSTLTATLPTNTGTIAETNFAQTFSATQTFADAGTWGSGGVAATTVTATTGFGANGTAGLASKTCTINNTNVTTGITLTIKEGLVTGTTTC